MQLVRIVKSHILTPVREKLFDQQMARIESLIEHPASSTIVESLRSQKESVLAEVAKMEIHRNDIPFLPVIPRECIDLDALMLMICGKEGDILFNDWNGIINMVNTPKKPYFIFNVENGGSMVRKSPEKAELLIKEQGRLPLTAEEVISVGIFAGNITHSMFALGSRQNWSSESDYAVIQLDLTGREPTLKSVFRDWALDKWGAASCLLRKRYEKQK